MDQYFTQSPGEIEEWLDFMDDDLENVKRVIEAIDSQGIDAEFVIHAKAETVEESASNTGIDPGKIVKTLVFMASEETVAVLCPGDARVDEDKLAKIVGEDVRMAYPREVKDATGYIVGGVSPFDLDIPVYMEESILEHGEVKPAAGSRVVGVRLDPQELRDTVDAEVTDMSE